MKALLLPLALLLFHAPLAPAQEKAEPPYPVTTAFKAWCNAKVPAFELRDNTFGFAYSKLSKEWIGQTGIEFPFTLEDFEASEPKADGTVPTMTMSLKDVPFREALGMICAAAGKQLNARAGVFRLESREPVSPEEWSAKVYVIPHDVLDLLNFGNNPDGSRIAAVYAKLGLPLDWRALHLDGDKLSVLTSGENHHRIKWLHELLGQGFAVARIK